MPRVHSSEGCRACARKCKHDPTGPIPAKCASTVTVELTCRLHTLWPCVWWSGGCEAPQRLWDILRQHCNLGCRGVWQKWSWGRAVVILAGLCTTAGRQMACSECTCWATIAMGSASSRCTSAGRRAQTALTRIFSRGMQAAFKIVCGHNSDCQHVKCETLVDHHMLMWRL